MKLSWYMLTGVLVTGALVTTAKADDRRFTYTHEPETLPAGSLEFENYSHWKGVSLENRFNRYSDMALALLWLRA